MSSGRASLAYAVPNDMYVGSGVSFATSCDEAVRAVSASPAGVGEHRHCAPCVRNNYMSLLTMKAPHFVLLIVVCLML